MAAANQCGLHSLQIMSPEECPAGCNKPLRAEAHQLCQGRSEVGFTDLHILIDDGLVLLQRGQDELHVEVVGTLRVPGHWSRDGVHNVAVRFCQVKGGSCTNHRVHVDMASRSYR